MLRCATPCIALVAVAATTHGADTPPDAPTADEVEAGLFKAISAFHALAVEGGHANAYSPDLKTRFDGKHGLYTPITEPDSIEMEPPATPWIGRAILRAYRVTGDERYLRMASEVADALAKVQAESGGWPARARLSGPRAKVSDMDDNRTQGCVLFLVELADVEPAPGHRDVMQRGLDLLLRAQYPSGGWPQDYPPPEDQNNYRRYHTINDATVPDYMRTLLTAY
ncbi:MAG: pectate lyase, partial [Armatimonadota bacterium]